MRESLLDRLLDAGPDTSGGPASNRGVSFERLRAAIERDLENLLNTRCFPDAIPATLPEVRRSLLVYGLTDFTSRNPALPSVRAELRREIEQAIARFEPRLRNVAVRIDDPSTGARRLMFKIQALLQVDDGVAEPVSFDTFFDSNRGEYSINRPR